MFTDRLSDEYCGLWRDKDRSLLIRVTAEMNRAVSQGAGVGYTESLKLRGEIVRSTDDHPVMPDVWGKSMVRVIPSKKIPNIRIYEVIDCDGKNIVFKCSVVHEVSVNFRTISGRSGTVGMVATAVKNKWMTTEEARAIDLSTEETRRGTE